MRLRGGPPPRPGGKARQGGQSEGGRGGAAGGAGGDGGGEEDVEIGQVARLRKELKAISHELDRVASEVDAVNSQKGSELRRRKKRASDWIGDLGGRIDETTRKVEKLPSVT